MRSCHEIGYILASEPKLSWFGRMELHLHLMMCRKCSDYAAQLRALGDMLQQRVNERTDEQAVDALAKNIISAHTGDGKL